MEAIEGEDWPAHTNSPIDYVNLAARLDAAKAEIESGLAFEPQWYHSQSSEVENSLKKKLDGHDTADCAGRRVAGPCVLPVLKNSDFCRPCVHEESGVVAIGVTQKSGECILFWDPSRAGEVEFCENRSIDVLADPLLRKICPKSLQRFATVFRSAGVVLQHSPVKSARSAGFLEGNWWNAGSRPQKPGSIALACVVHDEGAIRQYDVASDFSSCSPQFKNDNTADLHYPQAMAATLDPDTDKPILVVADGRVVVLDSETGALIRRIDPGLGWTWGVAINHKQHTVVISGDLGAVEHDIQTGEFLRKIPGPVGAYGCGMWVDSNQNLLWHNKDHDYITVSSLANFFSVVAELRIGKCAAGVTVDEQRGRVIVVCADGDIICLSAGTAMVKSAARR